MSTGDADPALAPYRLSQKAGKDSATVQITATHDGVTYPSDSLAPSDDFIPGNPLPTVGYSMEEGGAGPGTGRIIDSRTSVCTPRLNCGTARVAGTWTLPGGYSVNVPVSALSTGGDGDRAVNVYALTKGQGWA